MGITLNKGCHLALRLRISSQYLAPHRLRCSALFPLLIVSRNRTKTKTTTKIWKGEGSGEGRERTMGSEFRAQSRSRARDGDGWGRQALITPLDGGRELHRTAQRSRSVQRRLLPSIPRRYLLFSVVPCLILTLIVKSNP